MKFVPGIVLILALSLFVENSKKIISRMNSPVISSAVQKIVPTLINFNDTLRSDTLFIHFNKENIPVKYSRKVICNVCINNECRLVNIELFWNITGSYLGFSLPEGEFLTKNEHEHFEKKDYTRLHNILNNPLSPLSNFKLTNLVLLSNVQQKSVDAVSSATNLSISDYVVKGAAYTTFTLWQIVYGETKQEVEKRTTQKLSSKIAIEVLSGNSLEAKKWVLKHIPENMKITPALTDKLLELISGNDIYLAETSLNALPAHLLTDEIQLKLYEIFKSSGYLKNRLIIQKLNEAPSLNNTMIRQLTTGLQNTTGTLTIDIIHLLRKHKTTDKQTIKQLSEMLNSKNRFVANETYKYLSELEIHDNKVLKRIAQYKETGN